MSSLMGREAVIEYVLHATSLHFQTQKMLFNAYCGQTAKMVLIFLKMGQVHQTLRVNGAQKENILIE